MDPNNVSVQLYLSLNKFTILTNQYKNLIQNSNGRKDYTDINKKISNFLRINILSTLRKFSKDILSSTSTSSTNKALSQKFIVHDPVYVECFLHWWLSLLNILTFHNTNNSNNTNINSSCSRKTPKRKANNCRINLHLSSELISVIMELISRIISLCSNAFFMAKRQSNEESFHLLHKKFQQKLLKTIAFNANNLKIINLFNKRRQEFITTANNITVKDSNEDTESSMTSKSNMKGGEKEEQEEEAYSIISKNNSNKTMVSSTMANYSNEIRSRWYMKLEKCLHIWLGKIIAYALFHLDKKTTNNIVQFDTLLLKYLSDAEELAGEKKKAENEEEDSDEFDEQDLIDDYLDEETDNEEQQENDFQRKEIQKEETQIEEEVDVSILKKVISYLDNSTIFCNFYYHYLFINIYHLNNSEYLEFPYSDIMQEALIFKIDMDLKKINSTLPSQLNNNDINVSLNDSNTFNANASLTTNDDNEFTSDELSYTKTLLFQLINTVLEIPCIHHEKYSSLIENFDDLTLAILQTIPAHNIILANYLYQHFLLHYCNMLKATVPTVLPYMIKWDIWLFGIVSMWKTLNCEIQNISVSSMFNVWGFLPSKQKIQLINEICRNWDILFLDQKFTSVLILFTKFLVFGQVTVKFPQINILMKYLQMENLYYHANYKSIFDTVVVSEKENDLLVMPGLKIFTLFPLSQNIFLNKNSQYPFEVYDELVDRLVSKNSSAGSCSPPLEKSLPLKPGCKSNGKHADPQSSLGTMFSFLNFHKSNGSSSAPAVPNYKSSRPLPPPPVPSKSDNVVKNANNKKKLVPPPELKHYQKTLNRAEASSINIFRNISIFEKEKPEIQFKHPMQIIQEANMKWGVTQAAQNKKLPTIKIFDEKPLPAVKTTDSAHKQVKTADDSLDYSDFEKLTKSDTLLDDFKFDSLGSPYGSDPFSSPDQMGYLGLDKSNDKVHTVNDLYLEELVLDKKSQERIDQKKVQNEFRSDASQDILLKSKISNCKKLVLTLNQTAVEYRRILETKNPGPVFVLYNVLQKKSST